MGACSFHSGEVVRATEIQATTVAPASNLFLMGSEVIAFLVGLTVISVRSHDNDECLYRISGLCLDEIYWRHTGSRVTD